MGNKKLYPEGTKVIIIECQDVSRRKVYNNYKDKIGKKGIILGISAMIKDLPDMVVVGSPINIYQIKMGNEILDIPEELLQEDEGLL